MENEQQQQQQNESGKIAKAFEKNMKRLVAILNGESLFKKSKANKGDLEVALAELVKEDKESLVKEIKEDAKALIKRKREFDKYVKDEQKKMEKAIEEKKKEFNGEMEKVFQKVDRSENIEKEYYQLMSSMGGGKKEEVKDEHDDKGESAANVLQQ